ncbi:MEDS domain-containing protein [Dactylosporangium sp. NPDC050588]|uniref:MEDS domain-containing protein n=1 Tax=Dactylosporangium sp. NPDC050588 TaxID=3157211 RepID=UPI00340F9E26
MSRASAAGFELGDHVCWCIDDPASRLGMAAAFVAAGLGKGGRVVWCTTAPLAAIAGLRELGVAAEAALEAGQLSLPSPADWYIEDGQLIAEAVVRKLASEVADARAAGYSGLWAIADMSWAHRAGVSADVLARYELLLNRVVVGGFVTVVCQYDRRLLGRRQLRPITIAHPGTIYQWPPSDTDRSLLRILRDGPVLRLIGDSDLSNRLALHFCVADLRDDCTVSGVPMTIDASALRFADGATANLMLQSARTVPGGLIVHCSRQLRSMLDLLGGAAEPSLSYGDHMR